MASEECYMRVWDRAQRVPDTRPEPEIFVPTQSIPNIFPESSGISGIRYSKKVELLLQSKVLLV